MADINMAVHDEAEKIKTLLTKQKSDEFRRKYLDLHVYEQAQIFIMLNQTQRARLYRYLSPEEVGDMFNAIEEEPGEVVAYFKEMTPKYASKVIYEMYSDNAVDILAYANSKDLDNYLNLLPKDTSDEIRKMLHYKDKTAGAIMSTEYVSITGNQTVRSALHVIKKEALEAETIYYIYVVDDSEKLVGVLTLRDLLTNDDDVLISDLMNTPVLSVRADEDQADVAQTIRDYNFLALPVTNFDDTLIGIINVDDIIDVIDEESAEDYSGLAGVNVEQISISPFQAALKRIPWAIALLTLGLITALIVKMYQNLILSHFDLIVFMAMVMGAAGNAGMQSLAVAVRKLANKEDVEYSVLSLIKDEFLTGIITGIVTGGLFAIISGIWMSNFYVGLILGVSLLLSISIANLVGCFVPVILDKLGLDPSDAPGPLISTISDFTSIFIYLGLFRMFLKIMGI